MAAPGRPKGTYQPKGMVMICPSCGSPSNITGTVQVTRCYTRFYAQCRACEMGFAGNVEITHRADRKVTLVKEKEVPLDASVLALPCIRKYQRRRIDAEDAPTNQLDAFRTTQN